MNFTLRLFSIPGWHPEARHAESGTNALGRVAYVWVTYFTNWPNIALFWVGWHFTHSTPLWEELFH
jgi:hypothetical protein